MRLLLIAALALSPALSFGEESAKELYQQGTAAYALGHFEQAATLYEKAFSLKQDPALLFNAAQAHRQAGDKKRALLLYQNYMRLFGDRLQNREETERIITTLKRSIESDAAPSQPAPSPVAHPELTKTEPPAKPLTKRPWFWVAIGGGAAAVAAIAIGLGVGLGSSTQNPKATLGTLTVN